MQTEREFELYKNIEDLEETLLQYDRLESYINQIEEDFLRQNRASKELNDDLFNSYPRNIRLQSSLINTEELLNHRLALGKNIIQDCRDDISEKRKRASMDMDGYREELARLRGDMDE